MRTVLAPRATTILHDILLTRGGSLPYLLPANICPIVPITFLKARIPFEFVDISAETLQMDVSVVDALLRSRPNAYGGVLYAHTYGDPTTPLDFFARLKARHPDLLLIDDRCLCQPDLQPDPSMVADVVLYSTGYAKIVDIGFGGYAFLRDHVSLRRTSLPFSPPSLAALEAGYKACVQSGTRFAYVDSDWLQTGPDQPAWDDYRQRVLGECATSIGHRQSLNAVYNSLIPAELILPEIFQLWRFNLRVPHPQRALAAIFDAGLFASAHYASLVGIVGEGSDRNARRLAAQVINLFNDGHYTLEMAERTAQIVRRSL
jgi:hypothetical protein